MENVRTSNLVSSQLPDFVRSDYPKFVTFLEKYYEWLETTNSVSFEIDALRNANDIDSSDDYYIEQLKKDLAPYFPQEIVTDKRLFLKLVTQFYKSSGTQESVKFLFRALYNENIDIYYPKEDILKASDGKWVLPLALRIDTNDNNIFNIAKTLITGQTSKATALVEKVIQSVDRQLGITYTEIYVSNVNRLFTTGERITATYVDEDTGLNVTVGGRLIGALSEIKINPNNRGLFYNAYDPETGYDGDPVSIVGGLNPVANTPVGAVAYVGVTTRGGITDIIVEKSGFGFRDPAINLNSSIIDFKGGFANTTFGTEAKASINLLDTSVSRKLNVSNMSIQTLHGLRPNIANIENVTIANATTFDAFTVFPISFVVIDGSGGGYRQKPTVETYSFYNEDYDDILVCTARNIVAGTSLINDTTQNLTVSFETGDYVRLFINNKFEAIREVSSVDTNNLYFAEPFPNDLSGVSVYKVLRNDLYKIGSLGRITINSGGTNYANGDILIFTGGSGYGANAFVNVAPGGIITSVTMNNHSSNAFVIGGEGYKRDSLPIITIQSSSGTSANLSVSEITGDGEQYGLTTSRIGAITSLRIESFGYDYVEAPTVSLRNADIILNSVTEGQLFVSNTSIYQGTSNISSSFSATVDSYTSATTTLRIFNYRGVFDATKTIKSDDGTVTANVTSSLFYGDGNAKATANFENGLIRYPGIYLNTDGQISADKKLQDGEKYHNFSYIIKSQTDYSKFKKPLNDIVHPVGTKTFITKIDDNEEMLTQVNTSAFITITSLADTYNIANGSNKIITTNTSANLQATVNVGDLILLSNVHRRLQNTVNVVSGSNILFGAANSVNFINDLQDGDTIYLSTGNTVTIKEVTNSSFAILDTTINVTSTSATVNLVYTATIRANSRNANTIFASSIFTSNGSNLSATIQKVR
jgi:hypothetical protein